MYQEQAMRLEEDDDEDEYIRCKFDHLSSTLIYISIVDYCYDDETDYGYLFMNNDIVNIFRSVL